MPASISRSWLPLGVLASTPSQMQLDGPAGSSLSHHSPPLTTATAQRSGRALRALGGLLLLCLAVPLLEAGKSSTPPEIPEDLTEVSLEQLIQIKVTSVAKKKQDISKAAAAVYVITGEDIRRSGATSIPDALRMVPGLHVAQIDANKWGITSRGFNGRFANKLLVMIDGRTVYTPTFSGVYWDMQDVLLDDIDRIEVIRGPGATMWGSNAVNGVINVITKAAGATAGGLMTGGGGNQERGFGSVRYGGTLGDKVRYRVFNRYFARNSGRTASGQRASDEWDSLRGGFRVDWDLSTRDSLMLQGDLFGANAGQTALLSSLRPPFQATPEGEIDASGGSVLTRWRRNLSDTSDLSLQVSFDRTQRWEEFLYTERRNTYDIDFQHRLELSPRNELLWGLGYRGTSDTIDGSVHNTFDPRSRDNHFVSAFVQDEFQLIPEELYMTVGSKFERNGFRGFPIQPTARVLWNPTPRQSLWAAWSRAVRTPSRVEQDLGTNFAALSGPFGVPTLLRAIGNRDFESENLIAYELGYRAQLRSRLSVDVAAFYNEYDNLRTGEGSTPFQEDIPPPPHLVIPAVLENQAEGETYGVEAAAEWGPTGWWKLRSSYSWLVVQLRTDPSSVDISAEIWEDVSPTHQVNLRSFMNLPGKLSLDTMVYYVGPARGARPFGIPAAHPQLHSPRCSPGLAADSTHRVQRCRAESARGSPSRVSTGKLQPSHRSAPRLLWEGIVALLRESRPRASPLRRLPALLLALIATGAAVQAQSSSPDQEIPEDLTEVSLEQLIQIKVTSVAKKKQELAKAAAAVYVVTQDDIRRSGATSIPEALRMVPGLQVAQIDANKWAISSRGFNGRFANKLLVLIDGRTVYTPLFSGVYWDAQDVLLEDIDRIEVIRGPGATMWGSNAVNGVINVITKPAADTQGAAVTAGGGNQERGFGSARYGGKLGPRAHHRFYLSYTNRNAFWSESGQRAADEWDALRGGFRVDWQANERDSLTVQGDLFETDAGQTVALPTLTPPFSVDLPGQIDASGGNLLSHWRRRLSDTSDISLQVYFDRTQRSEQFRFEENRNTYDVDFEHRFELSGRNELLWGLGYRATTDSIEGSGGSIYDPARRDNHFISAFVQDELQLVPEKLYLTLGSKFERNGFRGYPVQPNVRLLWNPNPRHAAWGAVSRAVRTPSRTEQDFQADFAAIRGPLGTPALLRITGSREFKSETVTAYELGYRVQPSRRFTVDFAAFYNRYGDLRTIERKTPFFESTPEPSHLVIPVSPENQASGETYGAEIAAEWRPAGRWQLKGSYSWLRMQLQRDPSSLDESVEQFEEVSPQHQASVRSFLDLPWKLNLDTMVYYVDSIRGALLLRPREIPSYVRLDTRLGWRPNRRVELSFTAQNLLDERHLEFESENFSRPSEIGRSFYAKVSWRF